MLVNKVDLVKRLFDDNNSTVNVAELMLSQNVSLRNVYYYGEAKFLVENFDAFYGGNHPDQLKSVLNKLKDDDFKNKVIFEIVKMTDSYLAPVHHEDFISDAVDVVLYKYSK